MEWRISAIEDPKPKLTMVNMECRIPAIEDPEHKLTMVNWCQVSCHFRHDIKSNIRTHKIQSLTLCGQTVKSKTAKSIQHKHEKCKVGKLTGEGYIWHLWVGMGLSDRSIVFKAPEIGRPKMFFFFLGITFSFKVYWVVFKLN